jgi:hypothetical protein
MAHGCELRMYRRLLISSEAAPQTGEAYPAV